MNLRNLFKKKPAPPKDTDQPLTHRELERLFDWGKHGYFHTVGVGSTPLARLGKANDFNMWMSAGLTADNLTKLIGIVKECLDTIYVQVNGSKEKRQNALIRAGAAINEIEMATENILHTDLLLNFVACHVIRDDEPIYQIVQNIHDEKVEAFKAMISQGGASAFFLQIPELKNLDVFTKSSPEELQAFWTSSIQEQTRLNKIIRYLKYKQEFEQAKKTLEPKP